MKKQDEICSIYESCPILENNEFLLRLVKPEDAKDLLQVYSDKAAVPLFNSDNCNGDDFYYTSIERVLRAIKFWRESYQWKAFVRWSIIDKTKHTVIGTIELFNREATDYYNNCGLLRFDIRSDYENTDIIKDILSIIIKPTYELFHCSFIATKAIPAAQQRIYALEKLGFTKSNQKLIGHDKQEYHDYWVLEYRDNGE